jgi:hypothetical protein
LAPASTITVPLPMLGYNQNRHRAARESVPITDMPSAIAQRQPPPICVATLHQVKCDPHRRIFFAQGDAGRLMHRHHLRCRGYGYLRRTGMFGEFSRDDFSRTDQDDFSAELLAG